MADRRQARPPKVLVLGAGVIGVTTAWFLSKSGHEVTVVDRCDAPGMETSFANGGQISVPHAEPWANPAAPLKLLKWLAREDAPLLFRLRPDLRQWLWGLSFLRECTPARTRHNIRQIVTLGLYSRADRMPMIATTIMSSIRVKPCAERLIAATGHVPPVCNFDERDESFQPTIPAPGVGNALAALFQRHSSRLASRAPSASASSFAHMMLG